MSERKYIGSQNIVGQIKSIKALCKDFGDFTIWIAIFIWIISFSLLPPPTEDSSYKILFTLAFIVSVLPFLSPIPEGFREKVLSILNHFQSPKRAIDSNIKDLQKLIEEDKSSKWVNPELIMNIKQIIQTISENVKEYSLWIKDINKQRKYLFYFRNPFQYFSLINSLIKNEKTELISLIKDFTTSIQSWTQLHQKELLEVEQELEKQSSETPHLSGQGAIDLQWVRLHEHIENLSKITNTL